ncbi:MAG: hypothetical protein FJZ90_08725 [Chloroflexi bacterium]|nr:hypothetical protein [Chloroflexota bacterium]
MEPGSGKHRGSKDYLRVYCELIQAARYRGTVTYQEIAQMLGLPPKGSYMGARIGQILGEISEDEVRNGRPMLSALAVNVSGAPGPGFYALARELGRLDTEDKEAERRFWEQERQAVYETWRTELRGS